MKFFKVSMLLALAVVMALAIAASASATTFTGEGGTTLSVGTTIAAEAEGKITLHPPFGDIECSGAKTTGKITSAGGPSETIQGVVESLSYSGCNATITVLRTGSFETHTQETNANNNGGGSASGAEVTVEFSGIHCIFKSNGGFGSSVFTGSGTTGGKATIDTGGKVPRVGGRSGAFCGSEAETTGSWIITSPSTLNVD